MNTNKALNKIGKLEEIKTNFKYELYFENPERERKSFLKFAIDKIDTEQVMISNQCR